MVGIQGGVVASDVEDDWNCENPGVQHYAIRPTKAWCHFALWLQHKFSSTKQFANIRVFEGIGRHLVLGSNNLINRGHHVVETLLWTNKKQII